MNKAKHTPGPWEYVRRTNRPPYDYHISQQGGGHIVTVHDEGGGYVHEANAALIAASPELLAALDELLAMHELREYKGERITPMESNAMEQARAAIAKARGN